MKDDTDMDGDTDTTKFSDPSDGADDDVQKHCGTMGAFGLVIEDGAAVMAATRPQVRAAVVEAMRSCAELFQAETPMLDADKRPTELLIARRQHLGRPEAPPSAFSQSWRRANDPMQLAIREARELFNTLATEIFRPDPATKMIRDLPQSTFEDVEYFFDIAVLAKEANYDVLYALDETVEGVDNERSREMNGRARQSSDTGTGARATPMETRDPAPVQPATAEDIVEHVQNTMGNGR